MLKIVIPPRELFNQETQEFIQTKGAVLHLEHSLVSLSKWESTWKTPFLSKTAKSILETLDYVRCMTITKNVPPEVYDRLTDEDILKVNTYLEDSMTATTIKNRDNVQNQEIVTAEIIYYWMIAHNIPFECQKWHLNRLLTLINVCNIKSQKPKKRSQREQLAYNKSLNESRRKQLNTRG